MTDQWQKVATLRKTRLSPSNGRDSGSCGSSLSSPSVVRKGHFAVYTQDEQRFVVPIAYLKSSIFRELFRMSEEEFGPPAGNRPIVLPCDAAFMEHVVASLRDAKRWKKPCAAPFFLNSA